MRMIYSEARPRHVVGSKATLLQMPAGESYISYGADVLYNAIAASKSFCNRLTPSPSTVQPKSPIYV